MNRFSRLSKTMINNKLWRNVIKVTQLGEKQQQGKSSYVDVKSKDVPCIVKDLTKALDNNRALFLTEFIVAAPDLIDFDLNRSMLKLTYNGHDYHVYDVNRVGNINNEPTVIKMQVKR